MIHIRYILDKGISTISDGPKKEFWLYQGAVPSVGDAIVIYGSVFQVTGLMWMIGAAMHDEDTLAGMPLGRREADLHVVAITLQYIKDMP